jgi:hypothetical protein
VPFASTVQFSAIEFAPVKSIGFLFKGLVPLPLGHLLPVRSEVRLQNVSIYLQELRGPATIGI